MRHAIVMLLGSSALVGACSGAEPGAGDSATDTLAVAPVSADSSSSARDSAGKALAAEPAGHAHAGEGGGESLLLIMQQLGTNMTSLTYGLMTDDAAMVTRGAAAIARHAPIAPAELERIHGELASEMAEFERLDEAVHAASVRLHQAAEAGLTQEVLTRLNEVQRGCVACHVKFRARLKTTPAR